MPVSLDTTSRASATSAASAARLVRPASTAAGPRPAWTARVVARSCSPAVPVITTRSPRSASARASAANRSTGHRLAPNAAPGCSTTAPGAGLGWSGRRSSRSSGSAGTPCAVSSRHQRSRSGSPSTHSGPDQVALRCPMRTRGLSASSSSLLRGPRPCRLTTMSGWRARASSGARPRVGSSSSTAPTSSTIGASQPEVASTRWCCGQCRRSARSAGTLTSRSPSLSARSATSFPVCAGPGSTAPAARSSLSGATGHRSSSRPLRSSSRVRDSSRDTCIWEMPIRLAIWVCVMLPKNRRMRMVRSRSGNWRSIGCSDSR